MEKISCQPVYSEGTTIFEWKKGCGTNLGAVCCSLRENTGMQGDWIVA